MKKVILISGGSDGLGKATAEALQTDHTVIILAPNQEKLKAAATEIGCDYVVANVADYDSVEKAIDIIQKKYKTIDCLINNAGLWIEGPLEDNDPEKIRQVMDVNATGTIFLSKAVLPIMQIVKSGLILNVISQSGLYGKKERTVYHASKWAITGFTKSLEAEVAPLGIRVSGFYPGKIKTGLFEKAGVHKPFDNALEVSSVVRAIKFIVETEDVVVIPELGIKLLGS